MLRLNVNVKSNGEHDTAVMSIGDMARRSGIAAHVLRHWEAMGLLSPARTAAGRRRYSTADLYQVAVILCGKEAGLSLDDVRTVISARDPATRTAVLQSQRALLRQRVAAAQASLELVDGALDCKHEDFIRCPHFQAQVADHIGRSRRPPVRA